MNKRKPSTTDEPDTQKKVQRKVSLRLEESSHLNLNLQSCVVKQNLVLKLEFKNLNSENEEIKIVSINCDDIRDVEEILKHFKFTNFPNAFVVCIEVRRLELNNYSKIKLDVAEKLPKSIPFLLQINARNFLRRQNENFKEVEINLSQDNIFSNFSGSKLSTETFLNMQKRSKIVDFDLSDLTHNGVKTKHLVQAVINSRDEFCLRLLNLFNLDLPDESKNDILHSIIQTRSFELFLAYFDVQREFEINNQTIQKFLSSHNILLQAATCKNMEVVKFLLNFNLSACTIEEALKIALEQEFFGIFEAVKLNEAIVGNSDMKELKKKSENAIKAIQDLHQSILTENLDEIKKFSEKYPTYKLCLGSNNVCALEYAIDCKRINVYSYLRAIGFYTEKGSDLEEKISKLSESQKNAIRVENLKYVKDFPNAFIGILTSKCKFDACSPVSSSDVQEMLTNLSHVTELRPFLQIAAEADLKIIFDFNTESIKNMDPSASEYVMGLAYIRQGQLYVGRDRDKFLRYGTFMHELSHLVLNLIYDNNALPYSNDDYEREVKFYDVLKVEKENYENNPADVEPIVRWAFEYNPVANKQQLTVFLAELAVRPNHMMARYFKDSDKIEELKFFHDTLFGYFAKFVLPDLKIPHVYRLITLNKNFGVLEKVQNSTLQLIQTGPLDILKTLEKRLVLTSNVPKLALAKLINDIKFTSVNKLDIKCKNIIIDVENSRQKVLKEEFFELAKSSKIDRVIIDTCDSKNDQHSIELIKNIPQNIQVIVVCSAESSERFKFHKVVKNFSFIDLTEPSKLMFCEKEVIFQDQSLKITKILKLISIDSFSYLCDNKEISINSKRESRLKSHFIPRTIHISPTSELSLDEFWNSVNGEKIVLISDIAGSGKTTILRKVHEIFLEEFPEYWISYVSLIENVDNLSQDHAQTFQAKFAKILKLNKLEEEVFTQKFSWGEVKILFDGFDEISPRRKEDTLKLLRLFNEQEENQIWITTRTHLEYELENTLGVKCYKLKNLNKNDQVEFLCKVWRNSHEDRNFIRICAVQLTKKIADIINNYPELIGVPLIIKILANIFKDKINENFQSEIGTIRITKVYNKIIKECLCILGRRFSLLLLENSLKRISIRQALEYLTVVHYFYKGFANSLGFILDENEWPLEEIARAGLLTFDENGIVKFNHESYGQHILASIMKNFFVNCQTLSDAQIKLLVEILSSNKFEITRMFLKEMLEDFDFTDFFQHEENLKILDYLTEGNTSNLLQISAYNSKSKRVLTFLHEKICEKAEDPWNIFMRNGKFDIASLEKALIKHHDIKTFISLLNLVKKFYNNEEMKKFFQQIDRYSNENFLTRMVCFAEKPYLEVFFEEVLKIFGDEMKQVLKTTKGLCNMNLLSLATSHNKNLDSIKFLWKTFEENLSQGEIFEFLHDHDMYNSNVMHFVAWNAKSAEIFEFFWLKIVNLFNGDKDTLRNYLKLKGKIGKNFILQSARNGNEQTYFFIFNVILCEYFDLRDFIYEVDIYGKTFLHYVARYGSASMITFTFNKLMEKLSTNDFKDFIMMKSESFDENIFHIAARFNNSLSNVKLIVETVEKVLEQNELKLMLSEHDINQELPTHVARRYNISNIRKYFEKIYQKNFTEEENNLILNAYEQNDSDEWNDSMSDEFFFGENMNEEYDSDMEESENEYDNNDSEIASNDSDIES